MHFGKALVFWVFVWLVSALLSTLLPRPLDVIGTIGAGIGILVFVITLAALVVYRVRMNRGSAPDTAGDATSESQTSGTGTGDQGARGGMPGTLRLTERRILDNWGTLLDHCQGEDEGIFRLVAETLRDYRAPGVTWSRQSVVTGFWKGLAGKRRDFVVVRNQRFRDYLIAIGARDYGSSLDVSWYLLESAHGIVVRILAKVPFVGMILRALGLYGDLDVFDQQDLRAWVTVGHRSVRKSVGEQIARRKLEIEIDWKSRGTFAVS
jgi:hypothetical protein